MGDSSSASLRAASLGMTQGGSEATHCCHPEFASRRTTDLPNAVFRIANRSVPVGDSSALMRLGLTGRSGSMFAVLRSAETPVCEFSDPSLAADRTCAFPFFLSFALENQYQLD
ncbi:MAG: hypothetical protein D6679_07470 [Candidatus Hydrogenedentota bacterium]|nr:MAG: hypothetical protein D6679_07470 [Candidatus Hydrogenedentota bacterium]